MKRGCGKMYDRFFGLCKGVISNGRRPALAINSLSVKTNASSLVVDRCSFAGNSLAAVAPSPGFCSDFCFTNSSVLGTLIGGIVLLSRGRDTFHGTLHDLSPVRCERGVGGFFNPSCGNRAVTSHVTEHSFGVRCSVPLVACFLRLTSGSDYDYVIGCSSMFGIGRPGRHMVSSFGEEVKVSVASLA